MRRGPLGLALGLLLVASAGCPGRLAPKAAPANKSLQAFIVLPSPVKALVNVPFKLKLIDTRTGKLVQGATAKLSLSMPAMFMPPNIVRLRPGAPGWYEGSGIFPMRGSWIVTAQAASPRNGPLVQKFAVQVK